MASIDSSIVNVALPHIRGTVGATIEEITWISTAYIIATVLVMPLTGLLGALFGQKRVYRASRVVFVVGSMLCAASAQTASLKALAGGVALQGSVLACEKVFLLQGVVFLAVLPLLFSLKVDRDTQSGHVEPPLE